MNDLSQELDVCFSECCPQGRDPALPLSLSVSSVTLSLSLGFVLSYYNLAPLTAGQ